MGHGRVVVRSATRLRGTIGQRVRNVIKYQPCDSITP